MFMGEAWRNPSINAGFMLSPAAMTIPQDKIPPGFDQYGWHQTALGRHECYWTTSKKSATRNPEWNEEKEFMLRTGLPQGGTCHCQSAPKMAVRFFVIIDEHICGAETCNQQLYQLVFGVQCCTVLCFPCQFWSGSTWLS